MVNEEETVRQTGKQTDISHCIHSHNTTDGGQKTQFVTAMLQMCCCGTRPKIVPENFMV